MSRLVGAGLTVLAPVSVLAPCRAGAQTASAAQPHSEWSFRLSADGSWYENPQFRSAGEEASWSTSGRATLSTTQRFRGGSFSLSGFGGRIDYPEIKDLGQWTYGGTLGLDVASSRSTAFRLSQSYDRSNTRQLPSLDEEGLPVPTTGIDTATSGLGLTHRLSRRTQLEIEGNFIWRQYDTTAIMGGEQLRSTLGLARTVGKDGAVVLSYGFSQSWLSEQQGRIHQATLGARNTPERGASFEVAGGAAYMESTGEYYPTGGARIGASGRTTSASVEYFRDFGLAFGYNREVIADRVTASLGWTPTEAFALRAGYSYGYRRDPADDAFRIRSHVATGGFTWGITEDLDFAASYTWEQNRTEGFDDLKGGRATASLSYGIGWR